LICLCFAVIFHITYHLFNNISHPVFSYSHSSFSSLLHSYTIPLDKRLAADGRGLIEPQINDAFAKLSQALYLAERKAREEVAKRAALEKELGLQEKKKREEELRQKAQQARMERAAIAREKVKEGETEEERKAREERERLLEERRREREREHRLEQSRAKKAKSLRDAERDITEKIALGQTVPRSMEGIYDQRLFNQTQGIDSGFGDDEAYNIYDKPLFGGGREAALYKAPTKADTEQYGENDLQKIISTDKFRPDKGYAHTQTHTKHTQHTHTHTHTH
jgi:SNW domain-containing protein 1